MLRHLELFDAPKMIGYINAVTSLSRYGLSYCSRWTGLGTPEANYLLPDMPYENRFSCSKAGDFNTSTPKVPLRLRWYPPSWGASAENINNASVSTIVEEMDLLYTGGRLSNNSRTLIEQAYSSIASEDDPFADVKALSSAQTIFISKEADKEWSSATLFHNTLDGFAVVGRGLVRPRESPLLICKPAARRDDRSMTLSFERVVSARN